MRLRADQWAYVCEEVAGEFAQKAVSEGYRLYRNQAVSAAWLDEETSQFKATVTEASAYQVILDLDFFTLSECGCKSRTYCRHMAAAFFQLYAFQGGRPELFLKRFAEEEMARAIRTNTRPAHPAASEQRKVRERERQTPAPTLPSPESTAEDWHTYLDRRFQSYENRLRTNFEQTWPVVERELEQRPASWPRELAELYTLHVRFEMLDRLADWSGSVSQYAYSFYYRDQCQEFADRLCNRLAELLAPDDLLYAIRNRYQDRLEETARRLDMYATAKPEFAGHWLFVYRAVWTRLLDVPSLREREMVRLQRQVKENGLPVWKTDHLKLRIMHMLLLEGRESDALSVFANELDSPNPHYLFAYMHSFVGMQDWERLRHWLRFLLPYVRDVDPDTLEDYVELWEKLPHGQAEPGELSDVLSRLLPYSYETYSSHLLKRGDWERWVDLQLTLEIGVEMLNPADLRKIASKRLDLLLPLYHHSIERNIDCRTRQAYQTAVELLLKLRDCYYKLKAAHLWHQYIAHVRDHYSRLRAFQEELRKGKLVV